MIMKKRYDTGHKPVFFNKGDYVYLRLAQGATGGECVSRSPCSESLFGLSGLPSPHPQVCMLAVDQSTTSLEIIS